MIKMYRAVPKEGFESHKIYLAQSTKRTPSNVPYLVDNIWEWLRPEYFPSRRFAAYASPTPELALENASSAGKNRDEYLVCEVAIEGEIKIAHIIVKDARYHEDISKIMRSTMAHLGKEFSNLSIEEKAKHAALFMPAVSKEELEHYFNQSSDNLKLAQELRNISKFWQEAQTIPKEHDGELFFEINASSSYQLYPLT